MPLPADLDVTSGDPSKPLVLLLHGYSGNKSHMVNPGATGHNHNWLAPLQPPKDLGWFWHAGSGSWFELDPLKGVRSWRAFLSQHGYATAAYSQIDPLGLLARPVQELREVVAHLRNTHPNSKLVLLAHSRGGLLVRKFLKDNRQNHTLVGAIAGVITLHSPHQGSGLANAAGAVKASIDYLVSVNPGLFPALAWLRAIVSSPSLQELAQGSAFLNDLQAGEAALPGVTYATFGGTRVLYTRVLSWSYGWWSSVAQWHLPPYHHVVYHGEVGWVSSVANGPLCSSVLANIPELTSDKGDLLTTDEGSHLTFAAHRSNSLNHAEALWDQGLQQQVLGVLNAVRAGGEAKYGQTIKLSHWFTGRTLHSHALNYGHPGTSGQQQVTAFEGYDDNDLWRIKGPHGQQEGYRQGQTVQHGDVIRLEHVLTRRNLHSHGGIPSPVTRQQEVTCFGSSGIGDGNDNWRVEIPGGGTWRAGQRLRLIHVNTNHTLHSHAGWSHAQWTAGQQEVTSVGWRDDNDWWSLFEIR